MSGFIELLKQVGIFMVCSQTVLHFKSSQKYDKYLKLLVGIMVIAQLSMPLLEWATGGETLPEKIVEEETETAMDVNQMLDNADRIVDKYMDSEVKSRLNKLLAVLGQKGGKNGRYTVFMCNSNRKFGGYYLPCTSHTKRSGFDCSRGYT